MKRIKSLVMKNRKTKIASAVAILAITAGTSLAFYLILVGGAGSGTQTLGSPAAGSDVVLTAVWPDGISPGQTDHVDISAHNTNPGTVQFDGHALHATFTSTAPSCDVSAFSFALDPGEFSTMQTLTGGQTIDFGNVGEVTFHDSGVDQSSCAGAALTMNLTTH